MSPGEEWQLAMAKRSKKRVVGLGAEEETMADIQHHTYEATLTGAEYAFLRRMSTLGIYSQISSWEVGFVSYARIGIGGHLANFGGDR